MNRFLVYVVSALLMFCIMDSYVYASNIPNIVRVGLEYKYKNVNSVPITEDSIIICLNGEFETQINGTGKGFSVNKTNSNFVDTNYITNSYINAFNESSKYENGFPVFLGKNKWGVYLGEYSNYEEALSKANEIKGIVSNADGDKMILKEGNNILLIFDDVYPQIKSAKKDSTTLNDRSYRGIIEFGRYTGNNITAVNIVNIEDYLYSVVPSEMPSGYYPEALKAQTIAARTYTVHTIQRGNLHNINNYELCDSIHCQVYKGSTNEAKSTSTAVDETRGLIAYYDNMPINAVFHSSSGGHTDNSENVWIDFLPYLRGVPEINEIDMNTWTRTYTKSDIQAIVSAKGDNIGDIKDIVISNIAKTGHITEIKIVGTNGTKTLVNEAIRSYFSPNGGSLESRIFTINEKGSYPSGSGTGEYIPPNNGNNLNNKYSVLGKNNNNGTYSVEKTYVLGTNGIISSKKDNIVVQNDSGNRVLYYSKNNDLKNNSNSNSKNVGAGMNISKTPVSTADASGNFVFKGYGWGHGAGMSQKGANGMAQMGYTYKQILEHYYTGIEIK